MPDSTTVYEFAPYRLIPAQRQLLRDGTPVKLGGRAYDVLVALVERRDRTVSKNELMDLVWPTVVVEENNLEVQIVTLRKLLGHPAITTIPGRGYRFTVSVSADALGISQKSDPVAKTSPVKKSGYVPLPRPGSALVGRLRDQEALLHLLLRHRLVTLTGTGGIGKTRLAIEVANKQTAISSVAWADLGTATTADRVSIVIATALDVAIEESGDALERTITALQHRPNVLLVVDNAEHLIEATAAAARALLSGAANLSILTTSREPLRLDGEVTYSLGGLELPADDRPTGQRFDAVTLFIDRLKAAGVRFRLDDDAIADIVALCRLLDGMPLAIELAAARAPALGLKRLRSAVRDGLTVLSSHRRDIPKRQQAIGATLEWSYRLLSAGEQSAFRKCGVFTGGFTLEAFSAVAANDVVPEWERVDLLESLVDKSLVAVTSDEPPRYVLLETTRMYAIEQLKQQGEWDYARQIHAASFSKYFGSIWVDRFRAAESDLIARTSPEMDNLRGGLEYTLVEGNDSVQGVELLTASLPAWLEGRRQYGTEGRRYLDLAAQRAMGLTLPAWLRGRLCLGIGIFYSYIDIHRTSECLDEAVQAFRLCGDKEAAAHALIDQARVRARQNKVAEARGALAEAALLLVELKRPLLSAWHEFCRGSVELASGNADGIEGLRSAAAEFERLGAGSRLLWALNDIADAAWEFGDLQEAERQFRTVISLTEAAGYTNEVLGLPLLNLGGVLIEAGDSLRGFEYVKRALPLLMEAARSQPAYAHVALAFTKLGRHTEAAKLHGLALDAFERGQFGVAEPNERRSLEAAGSLLGQVFQPSELRRLQLEGAKMSEEVACHFALKVGQDLTSGTT